MTRRAPASAATAHSDAAGSTVSVLPIGEHQVALSGAPDRSGELAPVQRLTEHDRRRLENSSAALARRIGLAIPHPIERRCHLSSNAASDADDAGQRAVQLDDAAARSARSLVQAIDVLRDHPGVDGAGKVGERDMRGVGHRRPGRMTQPGLPGPAPQGRVAEIGLVGEQLLRSRIRVHRPCGPRKSGMPESVEMPAPVSTVTRLTPRTQAGTPSEALIWTSSPLRPGHASWWCRGGVAVCAGVAGPCVLVVPGRPVIVGDYPGPMTRSASPASRRSPRVRPRGDPARLASWARFSTGRPPGALPSRDAGRASEPAATAPGRRWR